MGATRKISNQEIIDFVLENDRLPGQGTDRERKLYSALKNRSEEPDLAEALANFSGPKRGRVSKYDDIALGIQLMDSGGDGFF
jgi:hypothetical protein